MNSVLRCCPAFRVTLLVSLLSSTLVASSYDERFLEGLRQRRLFAMAEAWCAQRLAGDAELGETQRADLVVQQIRTWAQHALHVPPSARAELWQRARQCAADYVRGHGQSPRLLLVQLQDALTVLARGELERREAQLRAGRAASLESARQQLRTAIRTLEELLEQTQQPPRGRDRGSGRSEASQLSQAELLSLQNHIRYQLARALRNQALCYASESPDRTNSLTQALRHLGPLARLTTNSSLVWQSRIDEVTCSRLLHNFSFAEQRLRLILASDVPAALQGLVGAEHVRLLLAQQQYQRALEVVEQMREKAGSPTAELDLAYVETCVAYWQRANRQGNAEGAGAWQQKIARAVRSIQSRHGPYWSRRADVLLVDLALRGTGVSDLDVLLRTADSFYRRGQFDDAIAAYERAAKKARQADAVDQAFDLLYKAAAVEHQRERHAEAAGRFRSLAKTFPTNPRAGDAHLLAVLNTSLIVQQHPAAGLDPYAEVLQEHLDHWPDGTTADKVRWWLGQLRQRAGEWQAAIDAYRGISAGFSQYRLALQAIGNCYQRRVDELAQQHPTRRRLADEAARLFEDIVLGSAGRLPEQWTDVKRLAALWAARFRVGLPGGDAAAEGLLSAALQSSAAAPDEWREAARALLVVALAGGQKYQPAREVFGQSRQQDPARLLQLLELLAQRAQTTPPEGQPELASLLLKIIDRLQLHQHELDVANRTLLARIRADALLAASRRQEALAIYAQLAQQNPADGLIQEGYAQLLLEEDDRSVLERALQRWRMVLKNSAPYSQRWFRAKYAVALAHHRLGDDRKAAQIIDVAEALRPELGGAEMKRKFQRLRAEVGN